VKCWTACEPHYLSRVPCKASISHLSLLRETWIYACLQRQYVYFGSDRGLGIVNDGEDSETSLLLSGSRDIWDTFFIAACFALWCHDLHFLQCFLPL
jgi:hypothetical protein